MIAGTRQKTIGGTAYRNDPLYAFGKAFTEAANDILTVENFDLFAEPSRAIRSTGAKEALKEFFCNNNCSTYQCRAQHSNECALNIPFQWNLNICICHDQYGKQYT